MEKLTRFFGIYVLLMVIGLSPLGCKNNPSDDKDPGTIVSAPTLEQTTNNSITVNVVTMPNNGQTVEYAINTNPTAPISGWQDGRTFTNLTVGTAYYIFARSKENDKHFAGTPSTSLQVIITNPGAAVATPTLESKTENSITINTVIAPNNGQTVEYAINTNSSVPISGWQDGRTFTNLTAGTTYYIFARSKQNNTYSTGTPSAGFQIITNLANINIAVTNTAQWNTALDTIRNGGNGMVGNPKNYTITINGNVQVIGSTSNTFGNVSNVTVTINGNGKLYLIGRGYLLNIYANQTVYIDSAGLTLEGLKVGQNDSTSNNDTTLVAVHYGRLEFKNGTIKGNSNGGVSVSGNLTMTGGIISNNSGRGVSVSGRDGSFTMSGGTISGNSSSEKGGGVYIESGSFTLSGGAISGNSCGSTTPQIAGESWRYGLGGGVYVESGTFTMTGGTINGNTARGGYQWTPVTVGGTVSGNSFFYSTLNGTVYVGGGGVYVNYNGSFTKSGGGSIYENIATDNNGNAVLYHQGNSILRRNATLGAGDDISTNTQTGWGQ